ncbi:MAG: glycosyl transferase [Planctomycetes bacterium]|nr:glycosyl transferase [Planctomycetota bacterium]
MNPIQRTTKTTPSARLGPSDVADLAVPVHPQLRAEDRVTVRGKFLFAGDHKFHAKGVTYGPFRPNEDGCEYHDVDRARRDFALMTENGINAIRTYTAPPAWLLDCALEHGLRVMVGLPWEQHVTFLDDRRTRRRILGAVRDGVKSCAGHPAIMAFSVGNEIPAPIARWHGPGKIERFVEKLYRTAKDVDPSAPVTYVSYPTTEYLDLSFLDFLSFNVFLEREELAANYLARLQNAAGELPLLMTEIGLDSHRNGETKQAETLDWQVRTAFRAGCAGAFVFSWTDEWHRGGFDIEDWAFGLVDRERRAKPSLVSVGDAFADPLKPRKDSWPKMSVVVCTYNGSKTIRECLSGLSRLDYRNHEVIVVDDGSTDGTRDIIGEFDVRLVALAQNHGLSHARNVGMREATGEIVAYIDDDAWPDPDWLSYLALTFLNTDHVGVGGPNLPPSGDGFVADCVAHSPGGPSHVLHSDVEAEHLPGCNMAFRRDAIMAIGGFDTQYRAAGDDVDLCWRLQECGGTLGFSPGAMVWHHRRASVKGYLKQQWSYGKAEAMLEKKWPAKFNRLGHMRWAGQLYGQGHTLSISARDRIDYGVWGSRLFQSMYATNGGTLWSLMMMPEWYFVVVMLGGLSMLGFAWQPAFVFVPLFVVAAIVPVIQAGRSALSAHFRPVTGGPRWVALHLFTGLLHAAQPIARLAGRVRLGLTPWRLHGAPGHALPMRRSFSHWSEEWRPLTHWIAALEKGLQAYRVLVRRGGDFDRWDLQADCGLFGGARLLTTVEEHGAGKQLLRVLARPRVSGVAVFSILLCAGMALGASLSAAWIAWIACIVFGALAVGLVVVTLHECSSATYSVRIAVQEWQRGEPPA